MLNPDKITPITREVGNETLYKLSRMVRSYDKEVWRIDITFPNPNACLQHYQMCLLKFLTAMQHYPFTQFVRFLTCMGLESFTKFLRFLTGMGLESFTKFLRFLTGMGLKSFTTFLRFLTSMQHYPKVPRAQQSF